MRPDFNKHTIEKCKELLAKAYDLEDEQIDPEAIMRMAIFISVVFVYIYRRGTHGRHGRYTGLGIR